MRKVEALIKKTFFRTPDSELRTTNLGLTGLEFTSMFQVRL